jgi:uncharacterized protein YkwD
MTMEIGVFYPSLERDEVSMIHPIRRAAVIALGVACLGWAALADTKKDEPELKLSKGEQAVLDLTNKAREKEELPPLKPNALLCKAARGHSANMSKQRELNHVLDGKNPADRVKDTGYQWASVGENIANGDDLTPAGAVELWMNSPPHKKNILSKDYTEIGIGIVRNDKGDVYYTQVFASPRKP